MKRVLFLLLAVIIFPAVFTAAAGASGLEWRGDFSADHRLLLQDDHEFTRMEQKLNLRPEARLGRAAFLGELCLDFQGLPAINDNSSLTGYDSISPWGLELREAYLEIYDFPLNRMDFRAGRQLIPWGAGDLVSPTGNLNPQDLAEIWDFGRRLGSDAVQLTWYPGAFTLTAVYIPVFAPARLPGDWMELFLPPELAGLEEEDIHTGLPVAAPRESSSFGLKLAGRLGEYDLSLSYVNGRYDLPLAAEIRGEFVNPMNPLQGVNLTEASLFFPRRQVLGVDLAGELAGAGIWAEAAVFFPEKVITLTTIEYDPTSPHETVTLNEPYTKYLVGVDYTFPDGTYLNLQFLHGFPHERGAEELEDYLLFALEKTVRHGRVKVTPLAGVLNIRDFGDIRNNYALVLAPEVSWYPVDGVELTLGVNWIEAAGDSLFSRFREHDELCLKLKYSF